MEGTLTLGKAAPLAEEGKIQPLPRHVAIIMDGNGRWARKRGLPRLAGHRAGTKNIRRIVEACLDHGIEFLTIYAFSTENWSRPQAEVRGLMTILGQVIHREVALLHKNGVQLRHVGTWEGVAKKLRKAIEDSVELTKNDNRMVLNVAFNYGGRAEIIHAVQRMMADGVSPSDVTEERMGSYLYTSGTPDPDLIIRTAGEWRLSNFLIWQAAYSEYWSTPTFWPDFGKEEFSRALLDYSQRHRRFGKLAEE
ncbi:MAG: polyprenyl diphosphate synthase [Chloroflexi bacterium]|nr:polyprenyl diphosphate synthase [Chloroflexota bacterium]